MVDGERLLLVEDDAATREVLTLLLGDEGWAVDAAESGEAALALLETGRAMPALVLCDLHLPGVCGAELARALRRDGLVMVAMTASVRADSGAGYDAVLGKPFEVEAVEAAWRAGAGCGSDAVRGVGGLPGHGDQRVLDEAVVATLRRQMGDARARSFFAFALADAGERVRRMESAIVGKDGALFMREAHAVKGSCGMIGARRLWRLASEAEMEGLGAGSGEKVTRMVGETAAVHHMLETIFSI